MYSVVSLAHNSVSVRPHPWAHARGVCMYQYIPWLPAAGPQKGNGTRQTVHSGGFSWANSRIKSAYMLGPEIVGR